MQRIPRSTYKKMPWKNGLGETAEIDRFPAGDGPYLWRLSQATIHVDSEFSIFAGYDRWLVVWQGDAIFLNEQKLAPLEPIRFSGDQPTFCRLNGTSVLDVGLIFNRTKVNAEMKTVEGKLRLSPPGVHYLFDLVSGDTMKFDSPTELTIGRSLLISVWQI